MTAPIRVSEPWLALREPADAAARVRDLADELNRRRPAVSAWEIHDLGCGTGAMARWLAPLLAGPQHWVLHDRDADLLGFAAAQRPAAARDKAAITVETRRADLTELSQDVLAGATLITASALLDLLTRAQLVRLIGLCARAQSPVLLTLSVVGRVRLNPGDPLDRRVEAAFNAHQRRRTPQGRLLGPDAVEVAMQELQRRGAEVLVRPSPWRLGAPQAQLTAAWLTGWVGAACEQEAELRRQADDYLRRRLAQARAGALTVTVGHTDLLSLPAPASQSLSKRGESA